jgi:hypothetical protein
VKRRNLVIVRAGDTSLHPEWLSGPGAGARNWDVLVNYFGDDPDKFRSGDAIRIDSKGPKWPSLHALIQANAGLIASYQRVWLPDDDLRCNCDDVNRLFEIFEREKLDLAQPSLRHQSYVSHMVTLHNGSFQLRYTNFIEVMAPCFTQESLKTLLPTFNANLSGWGLDYIWPRLLGSASRVAIIDDIQVLHTRPVGAANYDAMKAQGITAWDEMNHLLDKYNVTKRRIVISEAIATRSGRRISRGPGLLLRYGAGLVPAGLHFKGGILAFMRGWLSAMKHQLLN